MTFLTKFIFFFLTFILTEEVLSNGSIKDAVLNEHRKIDNVKRDKYRNPVETLQFFGLSREKKILEVTPGRGWYSEILSKYMKNRIIFM